MMVEKTNSKDATTGDRTRENHQLYYVDTWWLLSLPNAIIDGNAII
jgi:hypothetical protein